MILNNNLTKLFPVLQKSDFAFIKLWIKLLKTADNLFLKFQEHLSVLLRPSSSNVLRRSFGKPASERILSTVRTPIEIFFALNSSDIWYELSFFFLLRAMMVSTCLSGVCLPFGPCLTSGKMSCSPLCILLMRLLRG